jgi:hypothetical protein
VHLRLQQWPGFRGQAFRSFAPRFTAKLLAILPDDRRGRFDPNADAAPVIDIGTLGGNPPNHVLSRQNCCHDAAILVRSLASVRMDAKAHSFRT